MCRVWWELVRDDCAGEQPRLQEVLLCLLWAVSSDLLGQELLVILRQGIGPQPTTGDRHWGYTDQLGLHLAHQAVIGTGGGLPQKECGCLLAQLVTGIGYALAGVDSPQCDRLGLI